MFQQNPLTVRERRAEGAVAGRSWLIKGTLNDEMAPATAQNQPVVGYSADAAADNATMSVQGDGALVETLCGETLEDGDFVVCTDETHVELAATHNPANNAPIYVVGRVEDKNATLTVGLRVHVRIGMFIYHHGE